MPQRNRAAQFAPFDALDGYAALITETARPTEPRRELSDDARAALDAQLRTLLALQAEAPAVAVEHFVADARGQGGCYVRTVGHLAAVTSDGRQLLLAEDVAIALADIVALKSELLDGFESME